jgi:lipopolysaccharide/colanic/teichoic acid biosynthesis glycosyltransferase
MALGSAMTSRRVSYRRSQHVSMRRVEPRLESRKSRARHDYTVDTDGFGAAVAREQQRVDRSGKAFGLLTVESTEGRSAEWMRKATGALAAATRAGDAIGWLRPGETLGALLTDMHPLSFAQAIAVETRIRGELAAFLGDANFHGFSVRLEVYTSARRRLQPAPSGRLRDTLKRMLDLAGSATLLTVLSPLLLLVAVAVKLTSRGPVLFRQERVGYGMKPFTMLKYRTMRPDAGSAMHQAYVTQFIKGGTNPAAAPGVFKLTNDPRVTPIGRLLRKTSLDELPQLWNVVVGDMSLVGPRPPIKYEVDQYEGWHRRRVLDVKPGLTGLWQVTGRSRTTFDDMVRLDLQYARSYSLWTDLKILLSTPRAVIAGKGAC